MAPSAAPTSSWDRLVAVARRAPGQVAVAAMAVVGFGIALYLTSVHYEHVPLLCSTTGLVDCSSVIHSQYGQVPGTTLPITLPGLLWFAVSGGLAVFTLATLARGRLETLFVRQAQAAWGGLGLLSVLYLVYCEIVLLHHLCAWCTAVHVLILATCLLALYRLQTPERLLTAALALPAKPAPAPSAAPNTAKPTPNATAPKAAASRVPPRPPAKARRSR